MTRLDKSPETTANLHIAFVASCMYCTVALMWISQVVARKQDKTTFVGDPRPGQENGQVMTKHDYDVAKLREMFTSYLSGVAMARCQPDSNTKTRTRTRTRARAEDQNAHCLDAPP
jgi:hypothetical protein